MTTDDARLFNAPLAEIDPEMADIVVRELARQRAGVELIASENIVSRAVLEAQGSVITNKTVEGYPGARYHGGAAVVDEMERLGIDRARRVFGAAYCNLQPHSGTQANRTAIHALVKPGERILSMRLDAGGHLSHGAPFSLTGRIYDIAHYGVRRQDGRIDMDEVAARAAEHRPALIIAGGSAYPRALDFAAFRAVADRVGARLMVDMAHFAGLVAGGAHPTPFGQADIVTTTTTKTLRGPRGGLVLCDAPDIAKRVDSALFPGVQGSAHLHTMAAKTVCLGEALRPSFRDYAAAVVANARAMAGALADRGYDVVSGGTDTHLLLVDLRRHGLTGDVACAWLERAGITTNKNMMPFDEERPSVTSGLRFGTAAGTTRGFGRQEFRRIGELVADMLDALAAGGGDERRLAAVRREVSALCGRYPLYPE